jgi:hypothetical protein
MMRKAREGLLREKDAAARRVDLPGEARREVDDLLAAARQID